MRKKADKVHVCKRCGEEKPHRWRGGKHWRQICRSCESKENIKRADDHPRDFKSEPYYQVKLRKLKAQRDILKSLCVAYLGGSCECCGLADDCSAVYDFHHRNPEEKDGGIAKLIGLTAGAQQSLPVPHLTDALRDELDKCELLCALCHRRLHYCCMRDPSPVTASLG